MSSLRNNQIKLTYYDDTLEKQSSETLLLMLLACYHSTSESIADFSDCIADNVTNAHLLTEGEVVYDSNIEYICQTGYKHTGGELVRICQDDGVLSGEPPICTGE